MKCKWHSSLDFLKEYLYINVSIFGKILLWIMINDQLIT